MIKKHLFILEKDELILLSDIIKTEETNGYEIDISECGINGGFPRSPDVTGIRFVFIPKE